MDLSRLKAILSTSGLQIKDNALFQVISGLIDALKQFQVSISGLISAPSQSGSIGALFQPGSVIFSDGVTLKEDNPNFFWDDVGDELKIKKLRILGPGGILWNTDGTVGNDIGASGANRPNSVWVFNRTTSNTFVVNPSTTGYLWFANPDRTLIKSEADGDLTLTNALETSFGRINFGPATSSFPAIKRNGISIDIKLADDSAFADFQALNVLGRTSLQTLSTGRVDFTSRSIIRSPADGEFTLLNAAETGFTRLNFGGGTSSFPCLKRSGSELLVRVADDTADAVLQSLRISTNNAATFHTSRATLTNGAGLNVGTLNTSPIAGDPTKWIGIDDNGTTRYIPAW